jgi:hypothetical protein
LKASGTARGFDVDQAVGTALIKTQHPIAQRLAIHATDVRRLLAALSVVNRRQSQQPPHLTGVLYRGRQAA